MPILFNLLPEMSSPILFPTDRFLLIGGCQRSGTTIMGKLIGSLKNVEYFYEPFLLPHLLSCLPVPPFDCAPPCHAERSPERDTGIPEEIWKQLFQAYIHGELLNPAVAGRNLNFKKTDDSYIFNMKSQEEVDEKMNNPIRRAEIDRRSSESLLALKQPDTVFYVSRLKKMYPKMQVLFVVRGVEHNVHSMIEAKIFATEEWSTNSFIPAFPVREVKGMQIPHFVSEEEEDVWINSSEVERAVLYYCLMSEGMLKNADDALVIKYDDLISDPNGTLGRILKDFNLEKGAKTDEILSGISLRKKDRKEYLPLVSDELREKARRAEEAVLAL